ncbi:MAG: hypothetical protein ACAH80_04785 [Alphaproteobacteria bacterium]
MSGCRIREQLAANYSRAVDVWSAAVNRLGPNANLTDAEYHDVLSHLEEVRAQAQAAKQEYLDHVAEHNCK